MTSGLHSNTVLPIASPIMLAAAGWCFHWLDRPCNRFTVRRIFEAEAWSVSSFGRVRSPTGPASCGTLMKSGYRVVKIKAQSYRVHRLVATTFLGPPPTTDHWQVNHIDLDPCNNHASNLQWVSPAQNTLHSWRSNARRTAGEEFNSKPTLWRRFHADSWLFCSSQKEAAEMSGVSRRAVSRCCAGQQRRALANGAWHEFTTANSKTEHQSFYDECWETGRYPGDNEQLLGILVSNYGRIRFATKRHSHTTFGHCKPDGYCSVRAAGRQRLVHRMVAATFLGQPETPKMQVNHKDGKKANNRIANLEYVSASENMFHSFAAGIRQPSGKRIPLEARRLSAEWQQFPSIRAAALHAGVREGRVAALCRADGADASSNWEFRFAMEETLPGEEWRPVVIEGSLVQRPPKERLC